MHPAFSFALHGGAGTLRRISPNTGAGRGAPGWDRAIEAGLP